MFRNLRSEMGKRQRSQTYKKLISADIMLILFFSRVKYKVGNKQVIMAIFKAFKFCSFIRQNLHNKSFLRSDTKLSF